MRSRLISSACGVTRPADSACWPTTRRPRRTPRTPSPRRTSRGMTDPLRLSFDVACSAGHAFSVWTSGIGTWWPPDHTVTGEAARVVLQSGVGGRIYEQGPDGAEHEWGEVTVWQPPARLAYRWYLGTDPAHATDVEIRFLPQGAAATRIEIEHQGWERLGTSAGQWRDRNPAGGTRRRPHFAAAIEKGDT